MRRIVMFNRVSADGYFAAPDGNLNWVVPEPEIDRQAVASMLGPGTILFGRRTYEMFESFWPQAAQDASGASDPHSAGRRSPEVAAMAKWINEATKVVFSKTRKDVTWKNSRLLREVDPREVEAIKGQPGSDILIFGSGTVVSQLTEHGLIDEYQFVVSPILLGDGRTLLNDIAKAARLDLVEAKPYPSGNVVLRYARR